MPPQIDDKARSADFAPPSAAGRWAERQEIRVLTAGINLAYSQIIEAIDFVNSLGGLCPPICPLVVGEPHERL